MCHLVNKMEKKRIGIRRSLYIALFGCSLLFVSFYGGNVPYMFFFAFVVNLIFMVAYILYVFFSIKIYQSLAMRQVTKNELISYELFINNESFLAYRNVRFEFMEELSEVKGVSNLGDISLQPSQGVTHSMELLCRYSGTFFVGVDTIEIMDYFKILKIRFPMPQKMKVTVKPRILNPENLSFILKYEECHDVSLNKRTGDKIDATVRNYVAGDNTHLIHWKNSAKKQKLMVRTMTAEEIFKYVIIIDDYVDALDFDRIVSCDKLRELALALVNYVLGLGFRVDIFLGQQYRSEIASYQDFLDFYGFLTEHEFNEKKSSSPLLHALDYEYENSVPFVFINASDFEYEERSVEDLKMSRNVYLLNVNSFEKIEEFLNVEEGIE